MVTVMIRSSNIQYVHTILVVVVCFLSFSSIGPVTSFLHSVIHNHNHRHQQPLLLWDGRKHHLTSKQTTILYVVPLTENGNKVKNRRRQRQKSARSSTTSSSEDTTNDNKVDTDTNKDSSSATNSPGDGGNDSNNSKTTQPLLDWTSSGTIGSLLMQMQRKEEEMRKLNKTLLDEQEFLDLSPSSSNLSGGSNTTTVTSATKGGDKSTAEQQITTTKGRQQRFRLRRKQQQKNQKRVPKQDELVSLIQQVQQQQGGSGGGGGGDGPDKADDGSSEQGSDDGEDLVFSPMDADTAKELDDAVSIRISSSLKDVTIVDLPELYQVLRESSRPGDDEDDDFDGTSSNVDRNTAVSTTKEEESKEDLPLPLLSRKEHYEDRIGRDLRLLAVSIASSVDSVDEWRVYCQQSTGGIMPLVECIRVGARSIRQGGELKQQQGFDDLGSGPISGRKEECFLAAVSTCRALRDLCALSLELGAVITDDLLRANIASRSKGDPSLMDDLCTLLCYADDLGDITPKRRKQRLLSLRRRRAEGKSPKLPHLGLPHRPRKETRLQCKLYVTQLLLAMTCASDSAVDAIRNTEGLQEVLLSSSSYARKEQRRRWLRYPGEIIKYVYRKSPRVVSRKSATQQSNADQVRRPFIEAASLTNDMNGRIQGVANQVLAAIGYNQWVPKVPGQKGLRILCLDGGGSRGMTAVVAMKCLVDALGGVEVSDCFDLVVGTSTGAIIAFLVGLNLETSEQAIERYDVLIQRIFTKSAFSTPMMLFTTASYDEAPFMTVLSEILRDQTMLDSRANPAVPFVFAVTSKMSSTPSSVALFRNYNYNGGELPDPFIIKPTDARNSIGLPIEDEASEIRLNNYVNKPEQTVKRRDGSRHPGSFRVLQRYALRATTAAPTVFKPVLMGGEMYCDGGIVASNPSAIAIHEARNIFPDVPVELVVSLGTGGFVEQKAEPRIGWDGIIGQIVNSATDAEQVHHILEDVLGDGGTAQLGRSSVSNTQYIRFNPTLGLPDEFPIDVTDKDKLEKIKQITRAYMAEPEQQRKLNDLAKSL